MEPAKKTVFTEEEYLALEYVSRTKHEFVDGRIVAMAGGSTRHSLISLNIGSALNAALRGRPCLVLNSDQRVNIAAMTRYTYPDISVVCGEPRYAERDRHALVNPMVIIEVLSDSTAQYDLNGKLVAYRRLPSLRAFLAVHAGTRLVEHQQRMDVGTWAIGETTEGGVAIECLGVSLSLDDIYDKIDLVPNESAG